MRRILAVNPGSTSTKFAIFEDLRPVREQTIRHRDEELAAFAGRPVQAQYEMRLIALQDALGSRQGVPGGLQQGTQSLDAAGAGGLQQAPASLDATGAGGQYDAVVGRGGLLAPVPGGTYIVDEDVLNDLAAARRGEHASSLGPFLAHRLAEDAGCPAFLVDPVSVDEWTDMARYSGLDGVERESLSHALNSKATARRHAGEQGRTYEDMQLVVVHLGSGITVSAHSRGRMVDACNSMEEGPFAMDRAGGVPVMKLLELIESRAATPADLRRRLFGEGGVHSYLGTRSLEEVLTRIDAGDGRAAEVIAAMLYQVAKEAGAMTAVLEGAVDAVLVTGGMAKAARIADALRSSLSWIAPVFLYPGEDELRALAEGALRVLNGETPALRYADNRLRVT